MSETILLDQFRKNLAAHMAGKGTLKPIGYIAVGSGGHNPEDHMPTEVDSTVTELQAESLRKEIELLDKEDDYSAFGQITVNEDELVDQDISEKALCDTDGNLMALNHCRPKHKEDDETYTFKGVMRF